MSDFIRQVTGSPVPFFKEEQEVKQEPKSDAAKVAQRILQGSVPVTKTGIQASPRHVFWMNRSLGDRGGSPELVNMEPKGLILKRKSPGCLSPADWAEKFPLSKRNSPEAMNAEPEATRARLGTPSPRLTPSPLLPENR